jgi:purine catabolism regulator
MSPRLDSVSMTVGDLVGIPYLGTRVHAGASGLGRTVNWAHSCEVSDPWSWLDEGDMLMTNGYGLPDDADGQVAFVRELAHAGISAIAIGQERHAPRLTPEMAAAADEVGLPILLTAYEVPFVAVGRAVAEANHKQEQARLLQMVRLYDRLRESTVSGGNDLVDRLGAEIHATLHVLDPDRGVEVLPQRPDPPAEVAAAVIETLSVVEGPLPAITRIDLGEKVALLVPVPARHSAVLLAMPISARRRPELAVMQHVATIVAVEVERMTAEREQQRRLGAEALATVLDGRIDAAAAQHNLDVHGLGSEPLVLVACGARGGRRGPVLHHRLTERGVSHVLLPRGEVLLVALPDVPSALNALREELDPDVPFGISDPFQGPSRAPDAAREAQWALEAAQSNGQGVVRYGSEAPLFMPRTLSEAKAAVRGVLGSLLDYDAANGTELIDSLRVFLSCNRSWQRAAAELFVHKQTLVYRMRRVEELTGRKLADTNDVAELWLALRALPLCERKQRKVGDDALSRT